MRASVVLPTYNEAGNIVSLVEEILRNFPPDVDPEILVVDDDSPDKTCEVARKAFQANPNVRVILRTEDRGFAKSIRAGIELATGEWIIVMDSDFVHDPAEIPRMLHVACVYDIVSGSRFCAGGNMQDRTHYLASLAYNWFLRAVLRTQLQDNLGGYFSMKRETMLSLPLDDIFYGYGEYFFRLLYFAQRRGLKIVEIPAIYRARTYGASKSNFLKMLFTYSKAAILLRMSGTGRASARESNLQ
ncbi:MAG: glycosyltransferase [Betaproteobacteria bacterium]|nr:glycosyltransferase [Betaproteobacteria bacterium]